MGLAVTLGILVPCSFDNCTVLDFSSLNGQERSKVKDIDQNLRANYAEAEAELHMKCIFEQISS